VVIRNFQKRRLGSQNLKCGEFFLCFALNDLVMQTIEGKFKTVGYAELVVDLSQIILDDLLGCSKLECDFLIAFALGDAGNDRHLFGR